MFFLFTLSLLAIPQISPFNPYTYLFAFCLVTGTSIIKDGVEDYRKHKQDRLINHKKTYILSGECVSKEIYVESLDVGDFVIVYEGQDIPADVILLRSKIETKRGVVCRDFCYIDSSNLDGESNLKKKTAHNNVPCVETKDIHEGDVHPHRDSVHGGIPLICECDRHFLGCVRNPNVVDTGDSFTKFDCKLEVKGETVLCNEKNVLLKGMRLKNTKSILAFVVAVGEETKMGKSNVSTRKGHSFFEGEVSKLVYVVFMLYFILLFLSSILGSLFLRKKNIGYLYLGEYLAKDSLKQTGTNYIMFSYLIPLSLFVTLEVSRMFHATYISHDSSLKQHGVSSYCGNSSVTEDLGMVEFLLCDKTGTLTKNNMVFKYVHLTGSKELEGQYNCFRMWGDKKSMGDSGVEDKKSRDLYSRDIRGDKEDYTDTPYTHPPSTHTTPSTHPPSTHTTPPLDLEDLKIKFILSLLCCNGVDSLNNKYEGISQDEISILEGFRLNGIRLLERDDNHILLNIYGRQIHVKILSTLDFTSSRQRMSILVQVGGKYCLFTKGSDAKLIGKNILNIQEDNLLVSLIESNSKYRTLVVGYRELSKGEVEAIKARLNAITLEGRYQQEEDIFEAYEKGLMYLGTTFIEDELEDEVQNTLGALKEAGLKIWMVTGDKKETAVSCAIDCGIMNSVEDTGVLLVEGEAFDSVSKEVDVTTFKAAVVYRSTPHMKGKIALKFRQLERNTLAVGDGNNDVGMLQTANIGVGILGKEGNQAGIAGDFAVPGFSCLRKLILVHGRYNFIRFSKVTLNAFQKNIYFITIQFMYNFFNGFSGRPVYNSHFLNYYNVFFTSLVPATIALFDKDIPEDDALNSPGKYKTVRNYFSKRVIFLTTLYALFEGIFIFGLVTGVFFLKDLVAVNGKVGGYPALENVCSLIVFTSVLLKQITLVSFMTYYTYWAIGLSIGFCFMSLFLIGDSMWNLLSIPSFYFLYLMLILVSYVLELFFSKKIVESAKHESDRIYRKNA